MRGTGLTEAPWITFRGIASYHDTENGAVRGDNTIFCFAPDGMRVCHLGDLGHPLPDATVAEIGPVDVLLIPVGGNFTIDAETAAGICDQIQPRVIIPMHYRTPKVDMAIAKVDEFLEGRSPLTRLGISEIEISQASIDHFRGTVVLGSAL